VASISQSTLSLAAQTKILWIVYRFVQVLLRVTEIPLKGFWVWVRIALANGRWFETTHVEF